MKSFEEAERKCFNGKLRHIFSEEKKKRKREKNILLMISDERHAQFNINVGQTLLPFEKESLLSKSRVCITKYTHTLPYTRM